MINDISLRDINEQQQKKNQINFEKTIVQDDDNSCRPTFNDIIKLHDGKISFFDELEDDEYNENMVNQQIENDINDENPIIEPNDNYSGVIPSQNVSEPISNNDLTMSKRYIITSLTTLSNRITSLERNFNERLNNVNKQLNRLENNVNKRLSNMDNTINLIYERQAVQYLLRSLSTDYLITCEHLETQTFSANESHLALKFFRFVSKQLIKYYSDRWSFYNNIIKKLSLKPKCIEINLLSFGRLQKYLDKRKKIHFIESSTSLHVINKTNNRSSYVRNDPKHDDETFTHVLIFERATSPIYFEVVLFTRLNSSSLLSSSSSDKKIISMKKFLRKLLQLERIIFFLSFYFPIDLSQLFAGLMCFHFYHNSHIDTNLLLKNVMSSAFVEAIPLLQSLYTKDQFILTY
ncbi:unnamed protein product [Rotaria sp. Silwood1]|nr:unnamed protein product [Rotaria sp. Silwood1]